MPFGSPDNEDEIKKRALAFQQKQGAQAAPEEQGAQEEGFLDVAKPYKQSALSKMQLPPALALAADVVIPDSPLAYFEKGASTVSKAGGLLNKMREAGPVAKAWHELTDAERAATSLPDYLRKAATGEKIAQEAIQVAPAAERTAERTLDYSGQAFAPTKTVTDATTGFKKTPTSVRDIKQTPEGGTIDYSPWSFKNKTKK